MAELTPKQITVAGLTVTLTPADVAGDEFLIEHRREYFFYVQNSGASPCTVTFVAFGEQDGTGLKPLTVIVPAGDTQMIGPLPRRTYADPADNKSQISYDQVSGVNVEAYYLG